MYLEYLKAINARSEVHDWCSTTLKARSEKQQLDQGEVEHILDFLASDAAPTRLRKMSYKQAKEGADKWTKSQQKKGRNLVDSATDVETIHDFLDGTRIVRLVTKEAYQREGYFMSHCVGGYNPDSSTIYSYRDNRNEPHATFEVAGDGGQIVQIKGKGNGPIHPKYINPILTFLKSINIGVRPSDMINLGYSHVPPEVEQVLQQFVDMKGNGPVLLSLLGNRYIPCI